MKKTPPPTEMKYKLHNCYQDSSQPRSQGSLSRFVTMNSSSGTSKSRANVISEYGLSLEAVIYIQAHAIRCEKLNTGARFVYDCSFETMFCENRSENFEFDPFDFQSL